MSKWLTFYQKHWLLTIVQLQLWIFLLYAAFIPTGNAKGMGIFQMSQKYSICSKRHNPRSACQALCSRWVLLSNMHWGTLGLCKPANLPPQRWLSVSSPKRKRQKCSLSAVIPGVNGYIKDSPSDIHDIYGEIIFQNYMTGWQ